MLTTIQQFKKLSYSQSIEVISQIPWRCFLIDFPSVTTLSCIKALPMLQFCKCYNRSTLPYISFISIKIFQPDIKHTQIY